MSDKPYNVVAFNIPSHACNERPNKDKPLFTINGDEIDNITYVGFHCDAEDLTQVTVRFYATVEGEYLITDDELVIVEKTIQPGPRLMVAGDLYAGTNNRRWPDTPTCEHWCVRTYRNIYWFSHERFAEEWVKENGIPGKGQLIIEHYKP